MGRRSNAAKAVSKIIKVQKQPGFFRVVIKNGDKVIFSKSRLSKDEYLTLYLKNIESNITNHPEYTIEDIIEGYKNLWSKFTIISIKSAISLCFSIDGILKLSSFNHLKCLL